MINRGGASTLSSPQTNAASWSTRGQQNTSSVGNGNAAIMGGSRIPYGDTISPNYTGRSGIWSPPPPPPATESLTPDNGLNGMTLMEYLFNVMNPSPGGGVGTSGDAGGGSGVTGADGIGIGSG